MPRAQFEAVRLAWERDRELSKAQKFSESPYIRQWAKTPIESNHIFGLLRVESGDTEPSPNCFHRECTPVELKHETPQIMLMS